MEIDYNILIETVSKIIEENSIFKKGLTLIYELPLERHKKLNEDLFYRIHKNGNGFEPTDVFEIELGGIIVKFIKEGSKIEFPSIK